MSSASSRSVSTATGSAVAGIESTSKSRPLRARRATGSRLGAAASGPSSADVVEPTLPLLPPERVTITDYKSSDVRDPAIARKRARESLQLTIYAMGYEAMTGRLPDAVRLHFLETGIVGSATVDEKRLAKGREKIARAAAGIRARAFEPTPDVLACTYCPYRDICPASAVR